MSFLGLAVLSLHAFFFLVGERAAPIRASASQGVLANTYGEPGGSHLPGGRVPFPGRYTPALLVQHETYPFVTLAVGPWRPRELNVQSSQPPKKKGRSVWDRLSPRDVSKPRASACQRPGLALRTASRPARDKLTRDWVLSRNALHGAAPASASVLRLWNSFGEDSSALGAVLPLEPATGNDGSQRSWCHCWRLRCAAQVSVLRTKEPLSLTSKREKVFHLG